MAEDDATVEQELERAARLVFAVAAQTADRLARAREELARQAQHRDQQEHRQLEARFRSQAATASARLSALQGTEWWDRADISQIAAMHDLALQWRDHDPHAATAADIITREVRGRYGIDLNAPGADPAEIRAELVRPELERAGQHAPDGPGVGHLADATRAVRIAEQRDARAAGPTDTTTGAQATERDPDLVLQDWAAELQLQALEFETLAEPGGCEVSTPEPLHGMAAESRAQAQQYRDSAATDEAATNHRWAQSAGIPDTLPAGGAAPAYDSDERRRAVAARMRKHNVPTNAIDVAMRADVAQGRPAAALIDARALSMRTRSETGSQSRQQDVRDRSR